jgi:hypothetical protein
MPCAATTRLVATPAQLIVRLHYAYLNYVMRRDYPSLGCIGSTSTTSCTETTHPTVAWALPRLRLAARLLAAPLHRLYCAYVVHPDAPSSPLDFSSVGRTGSHHALGHSVLRLYCPYAVHLDMSSSPLDFSSIGRTRSRRAPYHSVSRLDYSPLGCTGSTASSPCIRMNCLHRSTSHRSVALALAVRPVTPSRGSATPRSVAPALLHLRRASGRTIFVARLLVSRSQWLWSCGRSFRHAP